MCFISRLPTESLEAIFIQRACDYHSLLDGVPLPSAPSWVNVSYVCRRWRNVALNCPTLWSYLFIASPRWTEELLARSQQAPLKVYAKLYCDDMKRRDTGFVEQVMKHSEHIQELLLHLSSSDHEVLSKLSLPAPRLQHLKITGGTSDSAVLFGGETPALRALDLAGCRMPWYSLNLSRLTMLRLFAIPDQFCQDTANFLHTLSRMQNLMHLYLKDALPSAVPFLTSRAFETFRKFSLPCLSRLSIAAPASTVIALLSCVNIPLQTEVRLDTRVEPGLSFHDYPPLSSLLAQRFGVSGDKALSSPTIRSLVITACNSGKGVAKFTFSESERDCEFYSLDSIVWGGKVSLQLILALAATTTNDRNLIISHICCAIPWSNVQSVHVIDPPSSQAFWVHVLGHLQGLRYIKLSKGHMPNLASVLSVTPRDYTESYSDRGRNQEFIPELEELELYDIVFRTTQKGDIDPLKVTGVRSLCDALATRKESRGRLAMTQCIVRNANGEEKEFDMEGRWEGVISVFPSLFPLKLCAFV